MVQYSVMRTPVLMLDITLTTLERSKKVDREIKVASGN